MSLNDYFYFFEWKNPVWGWTNHFLSFWISGVAKFVDKPTHLYSKNQTIPCNFHSDVNEKNIRAGRGTWKQDIWN